jgi:ribonuclease HI
MLVGFLYARQIDMQPICTSMLANFYCKKWVLQCREDQGVGVVLDSPKGAIFEQLVCLEYFCTINQAEYEAILLGLQILSSMGIKSVKVFDDSLLVMQQVADVFQSLRGH